MLSKIPCFLRLGVDHPCRFQDVKENFSRKNVDDAERILLVKREPLISRKGGLLQR